MKNLLIIFLIILIFIISFLYWNEILIGNSIKKISEGLDSRVRILEKERQSYLRWALFSKLATQIGKIPWSEEFDCYDHSKALQKLLKENGIESSIMVNSNRDHAWLALWVDANTGNLMTPDHEYVLKEVRDHNLQTICHQ